MKKFVLTLIIGLFFVAFSNAQNTNTEKSASETAVKLEKEVKALKKTSKDQPNTEAVLSNDLKTDENQEVKDAENKNEKDPKKINDTTTIKGVLKVREEKTKEHSDDKN